ncbi:hypothetical protein RFI_38200 [Reticulomyxa filosa]|uniref:Uncharacterized protein n=1 Tax=Reticulomyxa filosa TaxID=46433 RepID=X6LDS2_RETFI|nr:hypothetical protein RFI_38200 [Reticulomyxa filosa]|eukprot:ETN99281.1 hypothetical protein RFI_38200 [Reticulomyxa filosa]
MQLKRKLRQEKQEYLIKSIESLKEIVFSIQVNEFEQSFNNSYISTGQIAKTEKEHYQTVEDEITSVIEMNRDEAMNYYPLWNEYHQMDSLKKK